MVAMLAATPMLLISLCVVSLILSRQFLTLPLNIKWQNFGMELISLP